MARFSETASFQSSDSGVFLLDPEERALLRACAEREQREDAEAEAHRRFLKLARELPPVRLQKVLEIRRQIAEGTYLTSDKLEETVDGLLRDLRG
jgi:anti-sigma28 factor (negative regulator of flagellin synthesis)